MAQQHGTAARDRLWSHPDLLPTSDDLDEPLDFVARQGAADPFAELTDGLGRASGHESDPDAGPADPTDKGATDEGGTGSTDGGTTPRG
jgi:hypothetical protein